MHVCSVTVILTLWHVCIIPDNSKFIEKAIFWRVQFLAIGSLLDWTIMRPMTASPYPVPWADTSFTCMPALYHCNYHFSVAYAATLGA